MIDIHSGTWQAVKAWAEGELTTKTKSLESFHNNHEKTTFIRGEITNLRKLLGLAKPEGLRKSDNN